MKLKKLFHAVQNLPRPAFVLLRGALLLCCGMMAASAVAFTLVFSQKSFDYGLYMTAIALFEYPPVILLASHLGVIIIVDSSK